MAFTLYASCNNETLQLNDGAPFKFETLEEASNPPVNRLSQSGPLQHGATDLGYRVGARTLTLNMLFHASTASLLDTYRQTLTDFFAPKEESVFLYATRDDGVIRRLTCMPVGDIDISLIPEHYPGHLHRARVMLRAASPLWVDETVARASYSGADGSVSWWLAGGLISSSNVLMSGTLPTQGQAWSYTGSFGATAWTMAFRSAKETLSGTKYVYYARDVFSQIIAFGVNGTSYAMFNLFGAENMGSTIMAAGTHNYFDNYDGGFGGSFYRGTTSVYSFSSARTMSTPGTKVFRSDYLNTPSTYWANDLEKYAFYNISFSAGQRTALDAYMSGGTAGFYSTTINAVNAGDIPAYPVIRLTGPLSNITITNSTTGASFSLGTIAIGSADIYTIDLRDGNKQIFDINGVSKLSEVSSPVALANFFLQPAPIAAGGTNVISVAGTATTATSEVTIEHYNQYLSF